VFPIVSPQFESTFEDGDHTCVLLHTKNATLQKKWRKGAYKVQKKAQISEDGEQKETKNGTLCIVI
jgi:hypothetical protein